MDSKGQKTLPDPLMRGDGVIKRDRVIVRTSVIGILANVLLSVFKGLAGFAANSIAVILDAVNNLSDALSSVITIVGTRLAGREPDRDHPLGHGRIEYLTAMIISCIVIWAGIEALIESVKKIIEPEIPEYSALTMIVLVAAVLVKVVLGRYVKRQGEAVNSGSLVASGADALNDAILSASVLGSAIFFLLTGLCLEGWVGVIIAVYIIKSGFELLSETINDIVGSRADKELTDRIKAILVSEPKVRGACDLIINNYGPDRNMASVHLELPETMTAREIDALTRRLEQKVFVETGVILAGVGLYAYNVDNPEAMALQEAVREKVMAHKWALQVHGFFLDMEKKEMTFDVVLSFDIKYQEALGILTEEVAALYPDYKISIFPDIDLTD